MSGGSGTRLWPLSTDEHPKQFHALVSSLTMLQETAQRLSSDESVEMLAPIVICSGGHGALVLAQLDALGVVPAAVVLEPFGRNTAAAAVVAARVVAAIDPHALVLLAPADHLIADPAAFRRAIGRGLRTAETRIVTFGIEPTAPETGYGYIQRAAALEPGVYEVARFAEKPARPIAESYLAQGDYVWNAGIFLFAPEVLLEEMGAHRPDILQAAGAAFDAATREGSTIALDPQLFARTPSESVDKAVMEHTRRAAVAPCAIGWADVGSWSELWRLNGKDADQNVVCGAALAIETQGSLVWGEEIEVAVLGMTDVVVVATAKSVVVLPKSRAQELKTLLDATKQRRAAADAVEAPRPGAVTAR